MMTRALRRRRWLRSGAIENVLGYGSLIGLALLAYDSVRWEFLSHLDFGIVYEYRTPLLKGLGITLLLTGLTVVIGYVTGVGMAIAYQIPPFRIPGYAGGSRRCAGSSPCTSRSGATPRCWCSCSGCTSRCPW